MNCVYSTSVLMTICLLTTTSGEGYTTYHLEDFCIGNSDWSIIVKSWGAAIFKVGQRIRNTPFVSTRKIHHCFLTLTTEEPFGLAAAVQDIRIQGSVDSSTNAWICDDYLEFSTQGKGILNTILGFVPGNILSDKRSRKLCGQRNITRNSKLDDATTYANTFYTTSNELDLHFHQDDDSKYSNNSFTVVVTTFKKVSENVFAESCLDQYRCNGKFSKYCIDPSYKCDQYTNCAFRGGSPADEQDCEDDSDLPLLSLTTTIIASLLGVIGAVLVVCACATIFAKIKASNDASVSGTPVPRSSVTPTNISATAPTLSNQQSLPLYEAVIMSEIVDRGLDFYTPPSSNMTKDIPPSYQALFPDGPPKEIEAGREPNRPTPV